MHKFISVLHSAMQKPALVSIRTQTGNGIHVMLMRKDELNVSAGWKGRHYKGCERKRNDP